MRRNDLSPIAAVAVGGVILLNVGTSSEARPAAVSCRGGVSWAQARSHVGQTIRVRGPVRSTKYASRSAGQPTFLNVGRPYPDPSRFQVVIFGRYRGNWRTAPETAYRGKTIVARGRVVLYGGVAEIKVASPGAISVCR